jgi:hypothetical protein
MRLSPALLTLPGALWAFDDPANRVAASKMGGPTISVEKHGGVAGFGGAHLKSKGECSLDALSRHDREVIDTLFRDPTKAHAAPGDGDPSTHYHLTRVIDGQVRSVDVPEPLLPHSLRGCVRDVIE